MIRREFLVGLLRAAACGLLPMSTLGESFPDANTPRMDGQPFSKAWLRETAQRLAQQPYTQPTDARPPWLAAMSWDDYQALNNFRIDQSLWAGGELPFQARFFHLGLYFHYPVKIFEVANGLASPVMFSPNLFKYGPRVKDKIPEQIGDLGFAGFRVNSRADWDRDMFSFLGASYFRAVGASKQYGLSARGLAIDTGMERPEEFPAFRAFWLERPPADSTALTLHALLDSPSITGAYSFVVTPGDITVMEVESHLFPRRAIERIGIAPMTSMFQCGENDRRIADDYRPEIHDSDGLALWTGTGEWIWRPILNPHYIRVNSFGDENPRGFGYCSATGISITIRMMARSTISAHPSGWSRSVTGEAARCSWWNCPPLTKHSTISWPIGIRPNRCGQGRRWDSTTACIGARNHHFSRPSPPCWPLAPVWAVFLANAPASRCENL